jgi:hypothetical protein
MSALHLKLNLDKMELFFVPGKTCPLKDLSITVYNSTVFPSQGAKNLGVTLKPLPVILCNHQSSDSLLQGHAL